MVLSGICDFFTDNDKKQSEDHKYVLASSRLQACVPYFFSEPDSAASAKEWETLKRCEGFVILHVMFAVRQSHETGRILLNVLKVGPPRRVLAPLLLTASGFQSKGRDLFLPFNFGLLLAVTQVGNRIKDQASIDGRAIIVGLAIANNLGVF